MWTSFGFLKLRHLFVILCTSGSFFFTDMILNCWRHWSQTNLQWQLPGKSFTTELRFVAVPTKIRLVLVQEHVLYWQLFGTVSVDDLNKWTDGAVLQSRECTAQSIQLPCCVVLGEQIHTVFLLSSHDFDARTFLYPQSDDVFGIVLVFVLISALSNDVTKFSKHYLIHKQNKLTRRKKHPYVSRVLRLLYFYMVRVNMIIRIACSSTIHI
jgi:hypothetical protein